VLAVREVEGGEHARGVDGLPRPDRHPVAAQRADEVDQVPGQAVLGDGQRRLHPAIMPPWHAPGEPVTVG
jgi:hypothetical protein